MKEKMAEGYYFRKYGFVSNTAWSGIGGRHDDSMAGYGQGFFTQAALYMDDVNCYSKCLEGIARLGYDGNVIDVLSDGEISPFIMHECFHYENYEKALDHTFGALSEGRENVMNNRGDEGNLVQAAENLKAIRMSLGIRAEGKTLVVAPKLPWLSEGVEVSDFPVFTEKGMVRIGLKYSMLRYNRRAELVLTSGAENFQNVVVRFGPFSLSLKEENVQKSENAKWVIKKFNIGERMVFEY